jgi:aminoglycoside phosphotransferase (APT) family kinase protein
MNLGPTVVDAILAQYGIPGPWTPLPALGVANRIFATSDVVLRVATDHPDGIADARTESVAAPVASAAGILTPRMIAFDDTRTVVDRPFSLWERVHGETLGFATLTRRQVADVWRGVGSELAKLHLRVRECADPNGFLDQPARDQDIGGILKRLLNEGRLDIDTTRRVERMAEELRPRVAEVYELRFIHDDIHPMNVMCSPDGELMGILDWGDAGWGDPALDFAAIPADDVSYALQGHEAEAPGLLGRDPEARIAWNKLLDGLGDLWETPPTPLDLSALHELVRGANLRTGYR